MILLFILLSCEVRIERISQAITKAEGVNLKYNNPGGLTYKGKLLSFSTYKQGNIAMLKLISKHKHRTIQDLMKIWAPDGKPWYGSYVARQTGLQLHEVICNKE